MHTSREFRPHDRWFDRAWFESIERSVASKEMERGKKPRGHGGAGAEMPKAAVMELRDESPISQALTKDELEVMLAVTRGLSPRDIAKQTGREIKDIMHLLRDMCDRLELAGDVVWLVSAVSYRLGLEHGRSGY